MRVSRPLPTVLLFGVVVAVASASLPESHSGMSNANHLDAHSPWAALTPRSTFRHSDFSSRNSKKKCPRSFKCDGEHISLYLSIHVESSTLTCSFFPGSGTDGYNRDISGNSVPSDLPSDWLYFGMCVRTTVPFVR